MNAMLNACVLAALLTLAGHAGAQAVLKPPVNAKPGTGKTANVIMTEGGAAPCPKGPNGEDACTVTVTGERSDGGGGGGEAPPPVVVNGSRTPESPTPGLPAYDPGRDPGAGRDADARLAKWLKCGDDQKAEQAKIEETFKDAMARCVRDNPDSSGSIGIGINIKGSGGTITLPADWFTNPAAKRQKCEDQARAAKDDNTRYNQAVGDNCRARATRGG